MSGERARSVRFAVALALLLPAAAWLWWNPLVWPATWIERRIESRLPPHPTIVSVRTLVESERWQTAEEQFTGNASTVTILLGRDPLRRTSVFAEFTFDRFGQLVDLTVRKR